MPEIKNIFERTEKKFIISDTQRTELLSMLSERLLPDEYGESTVFSLYFDTESSRLIRNSIERPIYKEKLRLRSYGKPTNEQTVFIELKKKYMGIVYKRRVEMAYKDAKSYLLNGISPPTETQIIKEIDYFINFYGGIYPSTLICCDRTAFFSKDNGALRITFDRNPRYRTRAVLPENGDSGERLLAENLNIMEIKCSDAYPLYLVHALDTLHIYQCHFSKCGSAYEKFNSIPLGGFNV